MDTQNQILHRTGIKKNDFFEKFEHVTSPSFDETEWDYLSYDKHEWSVCVCVCVCVTHTLSLLERGTPTHYHSRTHNKDFAAAALHSFEYFD